MAHRFTVHGDSREDCALGLKDLETALPVERTLPPIQVTEGRWIARARPADDGDSEGAATRA